MKIRSALDPSFFEQGFNPQTDIFERLDLADRLTHLFGGLEHGTVSILDGRWGTGKTVFARLWERHLKAAGIGAIYFDAFASDYIADPFEAVSAAFIKAAADAKKTKSATYKRFLTNSARVARKMGVTAIKVGAKLATFGALGAAEIEEISDIKSELASSAGEISEEAAKNLLEEHATSEATFEALRKSIGELPDLLAPDTGGDSPRSLVVIIDELDRCRPDFALGVLEILKHFFRADRVHFVLVTNRNHLIRSVEKRYGLADGSAEYVQKYYDFVIHFEAKKSTATGSDAAVYARHMLTQLLPQTVAGHDRQDIEHALTTFALAFGLTLRQIEGIVTNVALAYLAIRQNEFRPTTIVCMLATLKVLRPDIYASIKIGRFEYEPFRAFTTTAIWPEGFNIDRLRKWFMLMSDAKVDPNDPDLQHMGRALIQHNFGSERDALPYLANNILDRFGKV